MQYTNGKKLSMIGGGIAPKLLRLSPMKTDNSTNSASPATGRRYWRSLDELADTPEFKQWIEPRISAGRERIDRPVRAGIS